MKPYPRRVFAVAPMMDWTDRHCRSFHRLLSREARLYTEMVTARAILFGDRDRLLGFSPAEHPVALQLGGADPDDLAEAARIGEAFGYDEINLNCGCPSDRVQGGAFGACLMADPGRVAACVAAMDRAVSVPVTVKCRIGIDDQDPETALDAFADRVREAGAAGLWVHARKAWLKGLSPAENRTVPPLDHDRVARLKARHPDWFVGLNGGLTTLTAVAEALEVFDGAMVGRAAYQQPDLLASVDRLVAPDRHGEPADPIEVVRAMRDYLAPLVADGLRPVAVTRHMLGLFHGRRGARGWRRHLATEAVKPGATADVLLDALAFVEGERARTPAGPRDRRADAA